MSKNENDERHKYNHRIFLKNHHLNKKIKNEIKLTFMLMNENEKNVVTLIVMIYELNEEKSFANEKLIEKSFVKNIFENFSFNEKLFEKSSKKNITFQSNFMKRIKVAYLNDIIFQKIMQNKRNDHRRVLKNVTKTKIKLEFNDCTITNNLFYVKNKLYVLDDEQLQIVILKQIHESSSEKHANKTTTYDRINNHYY